MEVLARERAALEALLPGFDSVLGGMSLADLEDRDGNAIELFRETGGTGLLVPRDHRGLGATALEAIRVQRAIGSRAPSLAIATTMHHFSAATLVELWRRDKGLEWMLLQAIAQKRVLLASGFAEGVRGQGVLHPTMRGRRVNGKVLISGSKKPCSLARSMDILTASVVVSSDDGAPDEFGVALISANLPGVHVEPFWRAPVLTGAQSEAVGLRDVAIEDDLVVKLGSAEDPELDEIQRAGFVWFELLITASYLGMASALVERAIAQERGDSSSRVALAAEVEATMGSLEAVARQVDDEGAADADLLAQALLARYAAQDAITRTVASAVELLGGMAFIGGEEVSYLAAASRALGFHPPARPKTAAALAESLTGGELVIG